MKRAFVLRSLIAVTAALVIAGIVSAFIMQRQYLANRQAELRELMNTISITVNTSDYRSLAKKFSGLSPNTLRVTFIAADGRVLGDSEANPDTLENHKGRAEIEAAIKTGYGEEIRHSSTLNCDMLYTAKRLSNGIILRLSVTLKSVYDHIWSLIPALLTGALAALACTPFLAWKMANGVVKPFGEVAESLANINAGGYGTDLAEPEYRELVPIVRQINTLSDKIADTLAELTSERRRISLLLDNMKEGLVVLDHSQQILLINRSACEFFSVAEKPVGKNLLCLTHIPHIAESAETAVKTGKSDFFDLNAPDGRKILQIIVNSVSGTESCADNGVILLITDVTVIRRSEQIRSEFVANASHELKTPLTSIKGFSELLESGLVSDPKKESQYLAMIHKETERMIGLISDILKLSELESVTEDTGKSTVSLLAIAQKVKESLSVQASEKNITVSVSGDAGVIDANPDRMTELTLNLIDNAIKYNRPEGYVEVLVAEQKDSVFLMVSDTGIGIPPEAQERVFERFYRVDKSRSRKIGGTGLGLSIVKHIVGLYKGKIILSSEMGKGTKIKVILPKTSTRIS